MNAMPVDMSFVVNEATQNDLVNRKLNMDALRSRLGDQRTKQEKLRETCEGFEAVFIQKMWEQMRKNIPKEGYLHSKDEETYQSMFDVELSKKMSSAGGIGLADMLYTQLSQQLEDTGRTTTPGSYRKPMPMEPIYGSGLTPFKTAVNDDKKLTEEELYSDLEEEEQQEKKQQEQDDAPEDLITAAVEELRVQAEAQPEISVGEQIRQEILAGLNSNVTPYMDSPIDLDITPASVEQSSANPVIVPAEEVVKETSKDKDKGGILSTSWHNPRPVSATPRPISPFAGKLRNAEASNAAKGESGSRSRGMIPNNSAWPLEGKVVSAFGWEDEPSGGRHWNQGIAIAADPGVPVQAILDGTVTFAGERDGRQTIVLEHQGGFTSQYGNVEGISLNVGDKVSRGANFAIVGTQSSLQNGPENSALMHFTLKRGEMALNPEAAMKKKLTAQL